MTEQTETPPPGESTPGANRAEARAADAELAAARHLRFGWWGLFVFASLGLILESMQGLRVGWYLDVSNETRRFMFRLAHAHGTLLALVNIAFALCLDSPRLARHIGPARIPSACLLAALILIPAGFFTGGLVFYDGDPGLGIMLVPVGALSLIVGTLLIARGR
jgi:hypothetical protein